MMKKHSKTIVKSVFRRVRRWFQAGLHIFRRCLTVVGRPFVWMWRKVGIWYGRLEARHPIFKQLWVRSILVVTVVLVIVSPVYGVITSYLQSQTYTISAEESALLTKSTVDTKYIQETTTAITYNRADEQSSEDVQQAITLAASKLDGTGEQPYKAELPKSPGQAITFSDSSGERTIKLTPRFSTLPAKYADEMVVYPAGAHERHVYTFKANGIKSDIVLNEAPSEDTRTYAWDLSFDSSLEARLNSDGSVGFYSANPIFFNAQAGDKDSQERLRKAQQNSAKDTLVFELPKPFILDANNRTSYEDVSYKLDGDVLTLTARNLDSQAYPLTIDPTITVTTTADFQQKTGDTGNIDTSVSGQISRANPGIGAVGAVAGTSTFTTAREGHASVAYNGYLYIIGGWNGSTYYNDIQYCPLNANGSVGTCTQQAGAFTTARRGHTAVVHNGYLYIIGGWNGSTYYNDIQYCPINTGGSVGTCTQQASAFTTARRDHASVVYNGYLYIVGGYNGSYLNNIQYCPLNANGSVGTCTQQTNASAARYGHTSVTYNGYLYIIGGDAVTDINDIQYCPLNANGSVGTCAQTQTFTTVRHAHTSVAYNGYLYIIGGSNDGGSNLNDIQYCPINANGTVGACTQQANAFTTARYNHTSVVYNGYLYVVGGYGGSYYNTIQYCPIGAPTTTIQQTNAFTTAREAHTSVAYNGYLYIIGGYSDSTGWLNDIQYCPLNANGSVGTCTQQASAFTTARYHHTSVAYNGYLYIIGGEKEASYYNDIQYCPLNSNGSVGACTRKTSAFTTARSMHASVAYNGYLYIIGGAASTFQRDIQYCPLNANGSVGTCTQQTSAFTTARNSHTSVVWDGYLYIIGGWNGSTYLNDIQYCPLNANGSVGTCTQKANAFTGARMYHTSVGYNGYLYIAGGWGDADYTNDIQYCPLNANGSVGTCIQKISSSVLARAHHTSIAYNGYLYVIGGGTGSASFNDIQYMQIGVSGGGLGAASSAGTLTTARANHASVAYNGYLYIIGGRSSGTYLNDIQYCPLNANGSVGTCTQQTGAFTTARDSHTSVVWDGYLYIIGGWNGSTYLNDIQYCPLNANGSVGTCTQKTNAFTTARSTHSSVAYNGYLYIIGGMDSSSTYYNDIQYCPLNANGSVGTCTRQTNIFATPRRLHTSVVYNGYLYIIGGWNGSTYYKDIQYCPLNANGSVGTCTQQANAFTGVRNRHTSVAYNGYLYIIGGWDGTTYYNDIWSCPFNTNGSVGACTQDPNAFTPGRRDHASIAANGYLYLIAGINSSGSYLSDIQRVVSNTIAQKARYERTFDTGSNTTTIKTLVIDGSVPNGCSYTLSYRTAGTSGVYGATTTRTGVQPGVTQTISAVGQRYLFAAVTMDDDVCDGQSTITSISLVYNAAPNAPTLTVPANGATPVSTLPEFRLSSTDPDSDSMLYKIEVCSTSNCSSIVRTIDQTASQVGWTWLGSVAVHKYQPAILTPTTQYWWRAQAIDPGGANLWSTYSSIYSFTTASVTAAPTLSMPTNGATDINVRPEFRLGVTGNATGSLVYKIDVCSTSNCSSIVRTIDQTASEVGWTGIGNVSGTYIHSHSYLPAALNGTTQYWWRAQAMDPNGANTWSAYSAISSFTTGVVTLPGQIIINPNTNIYSGSNLKTGN